MYSELLLPPKFYNINSRPSNNSQPETCPNNSERLSNEMVSTSMFFLHQVLQRRIENIEKSLKNTNTNLTPRTNLKVTTSKSINIPTVSSVSQVSEISSGKPQKRLGYIRNTHRKIGSTQSLPVGNLSVDNSYLLLGKNVNIEPSNSSIFIKEFMILKHADKYNAIFEAEASKPKQKIKLKELLPVPKKSSSKGWKLKDFFQRLMKKSKKLEPIIEENYDFENQTELYSENEKDSEDTSNVQCINEINELREKLLLDSMICDTINKKTENQNVECTKKITFPSLEKRRFVGEITDSRFRCKLGESTSEASKSTSRTLSEKINTISRKIPTFAFHRKKNQPKKVLRKSKKEHYHEIKRTKSDCESDRNISVPILPISSTISYTCRKSKPKIHKPSPKKHQPQNHHPKIRESQSKLSVCSIEGDEESLVECFPSRKEVAPQLKRPQLVFSKSNFSDESSKISLTKETCYFYDSNLNKYRQRLLPETPKCFYSSSLSTLYSTLSDRTMISESSSASCFQANHYRGFVKQSEFSILNTKATSTSRLIADSNETHVDISVIIRNPIQEETNISNEDKTNEALGSKTLTIPLVVPISSGRNLIAGPVRLN